MEQESSWSTTHRNEVGNSPSNNLDKAEVLFRSGDVIL
jgi:hypothetical protein